MIGRRPWRRPGRQEETESLIILIIGAGGLVGAIMRYLVGSWVIGAVGNPSFPYGTLVVNVLGCAMIGLLAGLAETRDLLSPEARAFLLVGLLGGFTTFSAFGFETISLARDGALLIGLANVGAQVVLGLGAVWAGLSVAQRVS